MQRIEVGIGGNGVAANDEERIDGREVVPGLPCLRSAVGPARIGNGPRFPLEVGVGPATSLAGLHEVPVDMSSVATHPPRPEAEQSDGTLESALGVGIAAERLDEDGGELAAEVGDVARAGDSQGLEVLWSGHPMVFLSVARYRRGLPGG